MFLAQKLAIPLLQLIVSGVAADYVLAIFLNVEDAINQCAILVGPDKSVADMGKDIEIHHLRWQAVAYTARIVAQHVAFFGV